MNVNLKLSGLYSSRFVIRFSLIFQKKIGGGGDWETEKSQKNVGIFSIHSVAKHQKIEGGPFG